MPLPVPSSSSYPNLDALLANAKQSLANANALEASRDADARAMNRPESDTGLNFANDLAHGVTHEPFATLKGFLSGAKAPAIDALKGVGDTAVGAARMLTTPPDQQAAALAESITGHALTGQAPSASDVVQSTTGVDPHASYARIGGQALGALTLGRILGMKGPEFGPAPEPTGAVEPSFGPSANSAEAQALRQPQNEGPIPVSKVAPGTKAERFTPNTSPDVTSEIPAETPPAVETPAPTPTAPGKPRLSAQDVSGMLAGREKFATANPDVSLPPGASDELDRMGVEYGRTQRTLKSLLGMPDADPAEIDRMNQGARELGSRLRQKVKGFTTPPPETPSNPIDTLAAADRPDYARVPFNVADDKTLNELSGQIDYSGAKLGRVSLKDLIATQPTVTRDVVAQKFANPASDIDQLPVGANTRPPLDFPTAVTGADGRTYLTGGTHRATAAYLRGEPDMQAVMYPTRGSAALAPEPTPAPTSLANMLQASLDKQAADRAAAQGPSSAPPGREGHFSLPQPRANTDQAFEAASNVLNRPPSLLSRLERVGGSTTAQPTPALSDAFTREFTPSEGVADAISRFGTDDSGEVNLNAGVPITREGIANAIDKTDPKALGKLFNQYQTTSLVGSPTTVANIGASNLSSLLQLAAQKAADSRSFDPLTAAARESVGSPVQMGRDFLEGLKTNRGSRYTEDNPSTLSKTLGLVTRPIGAVDYAFRQAAGRAGFSPEEALKVSEQQTPTSPTLKAILGVQQRFPAVKAAMPILRAPMNLLEQGVVEPLRSAGRIGADGLRAMGVDAQKLADHTAVPSDYVKTLFAAGAAAGYYSLSDKLDELPMWARHLALAASGVNAVPAALGYALGHAKVGKGLDAALQEMQRAIPGLEGVPLNTDAIISRIVPRGIQQLNPDYWNGTQRNTAVKGDALQSLINKFKAKIPGLSSDLPAKRPAGSGRTSSGPLFPLD